ncbi:hypothetical protein BLA39750_02235 [Burkholderia lata]|uniref:Uncharacterized protein n=1 Tax=Burkholderia lata (strain ATCC 17760 / DSM 23089 / LMG 22485 / NCIMB 9086 / R18194 / 383) TaxID=482957 RepID=A0A6P2W5R0_BURL3|nr:hypothetical protein [Burkholderia lata]VWC96105.1 hypothetical protein BLA39750_02235 [Burkholderia lata]
MKPECISALNAAAGRQLSNAEVDAIDERLHGALREMSLKDHAGFMAMSPTERATEAAKMAKEWMLQDRVRAHEQSILEASRKASLQSDLDSVKPGLRGQVHTLKNKIIALESRVDAMAANHFRLLDGLHEADSGRLLGTLQNPEKQRDIAAALFGEQSSPEARTAADSIKSMMDTLADRFQRAGLTLNKRDDYRMPQPQDPLKVAASRDAWVEDHLNWVDRRAYVNADGRPMNDDQLRRMLGESWRSIATDGANKRAEETTRGGSAIVGSGKNAPRQLFFKNSSAWSDAMQKYGGTTNMYELLNSHVRSMTKDIAVAEQFGRNAEDNVRQAMARAYENDQRALTTDKERSNLASMQAKTGRLFDTYLHPMRPGSEGWANAMVQLRGLMASSQLGSLFGALPDLAGMKLAAEHSGLPAFRLFRSAVDSLLAGGEKKAFLNKLGIWQEGFAHLNHRMAEENIKSGYGSWLNEMTHRLMGLNAFDRGMRAGMGRTVMDTLGRFTREHDTLASAEGEARLLQENGITENHWQVWRKAELDPGYHGSEHLLTPQSIYDIPNAKLDPLIEQRVAARSDNLKAEIEKRDAQTVKEREWIDSRSDKLNAARDKANRMLREFDDRRQGKVDEAADAASAHADVLRAHVERAEVEHDIAGFLKTQDAQGRIADFLHRVEDGESIERAVIRQRTQADNATDAVVDNFAKAPGIGERADRAVENYGRSVNGAAEALGVRRARADARIKGAEQRVAEMQKSHDADVARKAQAVQDRFAPQIKALNDFTNEMRERAAKRQEMADAFQSKVGNVLDEERTRAKDEAAEKLLEVTYGQMQYGARGASRTSMEDRDAMGMARLPAGTIAGELARFALQFKSVPIGIFRAHWDRMQSYTTWGSKMAYGARFVGYSALMGALATEIKAMINGQNPRSMNVSTEEGRKFWLESMAAGGGFGLYGDLFLNGQSAGQHGVESLLGPGVSAGWDAVSQVRQAIADADQGEIKHPYLLSAVRWIRRNATPFANLWYAKAAFNRLVYDALQDNLAPGSSDKQRQRMEARGASYWWAPGAESEPTTPDLGAAFAGE